jgi:hypothetical protein
MANGSRCESHSTFARFVDIKRIREIGFFFLASSKMLQMITGNVGNELD